MNNFNKKFNIMDIGFKIKQLRERKRISQPELANRLGISQATLSNIESGETKKIDFLLMDKVCQEFEIDFSYFIKGDKHINKVKQNNGGAVVSCNNGTINNFPESIVEQIQKLIAINKEMELKINELEKNNKI